MVEAPAQTLINLIRDYFPEVDANEAGYILWNETAYPFVDADHIALQLAQLKCREHFLCGGPFWTNDQEMEIARREGKIPTWIESEKRWSDQSKVSVQP